MKCLLQSAFTEVTEGYELLWITPLYLWSQYLKVHKEGWPFSQILWLNQTVQAFFFFMTVDESIKHKNVSAKIGVLTWHLDVQHIPLFWRLSVHANKRVQINIYLCYVNVFFCLVLLWVKLEKQVLKKWYYLQQSLHCERERLVFTWKNPLSWSWVLSLGAVFSVRWFLLWQVLIMRAKIPLKLCGTFSYNSCNAQCLI